MSKYLEYVDSMSEKIDWSDLPVSSPQMKQELRDRIAGDIHAFLLAGGKIEKVPYGKCTSPEYSSWGKMMNEEN